MTVSAREQAQILVAVGEARRQWLDAQNEQHHRRQPLTGRVVGYNAATGDRIVELQAGGQIEATALGNAQDQGRFPVQRFDSSQSAAIDLPTVEGVQSPTQISDAVDDLQQLLSPIVENVEPSTTIGRYDGDLYLDRQTETAYLWNADTQQWVELGGGGGLNYSYVPDNPNWDGVPWEEGKFLVESDTKQWWKANDTGNYRYWEPFGNNRVRYTAGDPNESGGEIYWQSGELVYDRTNNRLFIANYDGDPDGLDAQLKYLPVSSKTWNQADLASGSQANVYAGDYLQQDDGTIKRLLDDGTWLTQWYCPECADANGPVVPEDYDPATCRKYAGDSLPDDPDRGDIYVYYPCW